MEIKMAAIDLDGTLLHDDIVAFRFFQGYYTESRTQRDTHRAGDGTYV